MARLSRLFHYECSGLRASPRSLVATEGVSIDFLSSGYLDISVPQVRLVTLYIQVTIPPKRWVSPFGHPRIKARLSAPRGLSQTYTSFIAFCRQGIHRVRLVTWSYNPKPPLFAISPISELGFPLAAITYLNTLPLSRSKSVLISKKYHREHSEITACMLYKHVDRSFRASLRLTNGKGG